MNIKTVIFRLIILFGTLSIIGCQSADKKFFPYQFDTVAYQELSNTKKVILVPTQLFNPKKTVDKTYSSLDLAIKEYLEKQGFEVFTSDQTLKLWSDYKQQSGGFYDQKTGEIIRSRVRENIEKTIASLRAKSGFSVSIIPNVQYRPIKLAKKSLDKAVWNGVSRDVDSNRGRNNRWLQHVGMTLAITVVAGDPLDAIFKGKGGNRSPPYIN